MKRLPAKLPLPMAVIVRNISLNAMNIIKLHKPMYNIKTSPYCPRDRVVFSANSR